MWAHASLQGPCQRVDIVCLAPQRCTDVHHQFSGFHYTVRFLLCDLFSTHIYTTDRIWNVENKRKQKTVIVVKSKERGARTKVTTCGYSPDGRYIAGGAPPAIMSHHLGAHR